MTHIQPGDRVIWTVRPDLVDKDGQPAVAIVVDRLPDGECSHRPRGRRVVLAYANRQTAIAWTDDLSKTERTESSPQPLVLVDALLKVNVSGL